MKYITPKHMPYISESIQRVLKETRELAYARGYKAGRGELADPGPIDNAEIKDLILKRGLTATNVIDAVCELNGFVGVGFLTFGDAIGGYIRDKASAGMRSQEFYLNS